MGPATIVVSFDIPRITADYLVEILNCKAERAFCCIDLTTLIIGNLVISADRYPAVKLADDTILGKLILARRNRRRRDDAFLAIVPLVRVILIPPKNGIRTKAELDSQ